MSGPRSDATKAIFAFIEENAPVSHQVLLDKFRPQAAAVGMSAASWLDGRLNNMRTAGFIDHTASGWVALRVLSAGRVERPPRRARPVAEPTADTSVAQPRRVGMFGDVYTPSTPVHRTGANDYASHPSVINGQPRPYRRAW